MSGRSSAVERHLAKVDVESSILFARSNPFFGITRDLSARFGAKSSTHSAIGAPGPMLGIVSRARLRRLSHLLAEPSMQQFIKFA